MQKAKRAQGTGIPFYKLHGAGNDILVVFAKDLPRTGKGKLLHQMRAKRFAVTLEPVALETGSHRTRGKGLAGIRPFFGAP